MRTRLLRSRWMALTALLAALGATVDSGRASAQSEAETLSTSFRKAARQTLPSVVSIRPQTHGVPPGSPSPLAAGLPPASRLVPGGSGVVIDATRGLVLTNNHVLGDGSPVVVALSDGRERTVLRVDRDPKSDLALLTLTDASGLVQAPWGDSAAIDTGDWVLAIGQPFGLSGTVTAGIVSGKGRGIGVALYEDLIQTDAAINPGNSGGPLINLRGEIVGITTAMKTANGGFEGVGFALPSARARRVADDLAAFGRVRRSYLGINIRKVDPRTAERIGRPDAAMIYGVAEGSPAAQAGLRPGDVILAMGARSLDGTAPLQTAIEIAPVGEPLSLTIDRDGATRQISVRPAPQPERFGLTEPVPPLDSVRVVERPVVADRVEPRSQVVTLPELGLTLEEDIPGIILVRDVETNSPADQGGLEPGMQLVDLNGKPLTNLTELRSRVENRPDMGGDLRLGIVKRGKPGVRLIPRNGRESQRDRRPAPEPGAALDLPASAPLPRLKPET